MNGSVGKREADNLVYKEKKVRQMTNFSLMGQHFHIVKEKKIRLIFLRVEGVPGAGYGAAMGQKGKASLVVTACGHESLCEKGFRGRDGPLSL
jgi:hypothetical protein